MEGHIDINCPVTRKPCPQLEGISDEYFRPISDYEWVENGADVRANDITLGHQRVAELNRAARAQPGLCIDTFDGCGVTKGWEIDQNCKPLTRRAAAARILKNLLIKEA